MVIIVLLRDDTPHKLIIGSNKNKKMTKHIFISIFLIQLIPVALFSQTSIISYNIRYSTQNDNENQWEYRKAEVVQLIEYYSPEIVGIQEGLDGQVKYLDTLLNNYSYVGVGRDDGKLKGEYAAIFYKKERLKLISTKTYWLSETPDKVSVGWDASMERVTTFGEFYDIQTKDTLYVFNCHFDHIGKTSRKNSAKLILEIIENRKISNKKIVVMGDLNCEPEDEPMEILQSELEDSYNRTGTVTYGPVGTFNQFNTEMLLQTRIDYILVKNIEVKEYRHIDDRRKNNLYPSDHLPVQIKIE